MLVGLGFGGAWLVTRGPAVLAGAVDLADGPTGTVRVDDQDDVPALAAVPDIGTPPADLPGAEGLDPELVARLLVARDGAAADGIELRIVSGKRTAEEQQALVDSAVRRHGSLEEAQRWVLPPEVSAHVQGLAVDIGPTDAALWVGARQEELGLCRTYGNEMWHFELTGAIGDPCPVPWPDASHGWR